MTPKNMKMTGYYLEHRGQGHRKFYFIAVGENGMYATQWGRIGTNGQSTINALPSGPDADAMGEKQMYKKMSGGYQMVHNAVPFEIDTDTLASVTQGRNSFSVLAGHFWEAQSKLKGTATSAVLDAYDGFLAETARVLDTLSGGGTFDDFQALDELWIKVQDKHAEAEIIMNLAKQSAITGLVST